MTAPNIAAQLSCNSKGVPYPNHANVVFVLQHDPTFTPARVWYDEFLDRVFLANSPTREWRDDDDTRITVDLQDRFGIRNLAQNVVAVSVRLVARQRVRHCVREYLEPLIWDGEPRIDHAFSDYWGAEHTAYTQAASRNFLIGLVARVMCPGCKLDTMPVFEGPQGVKKSMALEALGGSWYHIARESVDSKDFLQNLRGKILVEIAELQSFARADVRAIKNVLSTRNDDYRPSYGRYSVRFPRQCVFAGTSNPNDWGNDETGLRRFWPIACGEINVEALLKVRDQLFAEALVCYRAGATWWEMPDTTFAVQASRQHYDEWTQPILEWVAIQPTDDGIRLRDVITQALKIPLDRIDMRIQLRAGRIMKLAGWGNKDEREGQQIIKKWRKNSESVAKHNTEVF